MTASTLAARLVTHDDVRYINHQLTASGVPVTAQLDGPPGTILLHCALSPTTPQIARTLHVIRAVTCAPMHWAGA